MLDLSKMRVQPVEIPIEFSIELPSCFTSLFDDWIFHDYQPSISSCGV